MDAKRPTPRHILIKMPRLEIKNLKSSKKKAVSYLQGSSHKTVSSFLKRNFAGQKGLARNSGSQERQGPIPRLCYPAKLSFRIEGQIKSFPDKKRLKEFMIIKPLLYEMLKGTSSSLIRI